MMDDLEGEDAFYVFEEKISQGKMDIIYIMKKIR